MCVALRERERREKREERRERIILTGCTIL